MTIFKAYYTDNHSNADYLIGYFRNYDSAIKATSSHKLAEGHYTAQIMEYTLHDDAEEYCKERRKKLAVQAKAKLTPEEREALGI